jgi:hypothetical protein
VAARAEITDADREKLEQVRKVHRIFFSARFEVYGAIKPKVGDILRPPDLRANYLQRLESDIVAYCLLNDIPIRTIRLKPRQKGSSTWSVWKQFCLLSDSLARGLIMGGAHFQGQNLFKMLTTYAGHDRFDPKIRWQVLDREARCTNGSTIERVTAANKEAGRSGTYQSLIATEYARWAEEGVANAADVLAGAIKTVADAPLTMVDIESTANGASGDFYERYWGGITFEELKQGKRGFVRVFCPWFRFEDSRRDPLLELGREECVPAAKVAELRAKFDLDEEQIAWMQWATREECKRDFDVFCEEYPFDEESAFRKSGRQRFNSNKLAAMKEEAQKYPPAFGNIDVVEKNRVVWRPSVSSESRIVRWEQPRIGCRYLLAVDSMTGETQVGGKDPDNHAVGVIRAGMFTADGGWSPPILAARLVADWDLWERSRKYELRWDIDVLEEQIWRLAQYYGNCVIVPEMNADRGIVELLKMRQGAKIYVRKLFNQREQTETNAYGWYTDVRTRELVVETLARAIREHGKRGEGCEIFCPIALDELQNFVVKPSGRSEAASGSHDDNVLMLAIGLTTIEAATAYAEPKVEVKLPWDLRKLEEGERLSKPGMAMKW